MILRHTSEIRLSKHSSIIFSSKLGNILISENKNSLEFSGWKTKDSYSNEVSFIIKNLIKNEPIENKFFNRPNSPKGTSDEYNIPDSVQEKLKLMSEDTEGTFNVSSNLQNTG